MVLTACLAFPCVDARAQVAAAPATAPGIVKLNFPENLELKTLVDYVGQRQGINFIYDENIANKRITIKAPQEIPAESLMTLLESALRMKGLVLTRTDVPGTMRIEALGKLSALSGGPTTMPATLPADRSASAVTRVIELKHCKPARVEQVVGTFLSVTAASVTALAEHNMVIITDYADNMRKLEDLVALLDRPGPEVSIQFIRVSQQEASVVAQQATQLLAGRMKARDGGGATAAVPSVTVMADERTNRVAVVGTAEDVATAVTVIQDLDLPLGMETKIYTFSTATAEDVDRLARLMVGELAAKRFYKSVTDRVSNLLILTATADVHKQVDLLVKTLDKPVAETQSPIRFYKLENAKATAVLETLQSIQGDAGLRAVSLDGVSSATQPGLPAEEKVFKGPTEAQVNGTEPRGKDLAGAATHRKAIQVGDTRIMADEMSNTIIVVATPAMHPLYEKLIKRLDVRRPQVLIEATLITLDTTGEFKLGVEFSKTTSVEKGKGKVLTFSQFGLSATDDTTGAITLKPGVGFNGALISTDIANIILQALKHDDRVHVLAQPTILVNDNAEGRLVSQQEEPYVTVNASSQVALNTFGGYSAAGTNIKIKPQISEGDNLKLEYEIALSSFNGTSSGGLPPARQTNSLTSEATIPNGHTIILGGLSRDTHNDNIDRIPILGEIPLLEYAFSNRRNTIRKSTLFVFIHAVILRSDKFEDLKVLSSDAARTAGLPAAYPISEPVEIR